MKAYWLPLRYLLSALQRLTAKCPTHNIAASSPIRESKNPKRKLSRHRAFLELP